MDKDQLKLLSDTVAKADNATIANPHIDSVKTVEGVAKVNVTYSLNGKNVNDSLTINKDGSKFLLFPNWKTRAHCSRPSPCRCPMPWNRCPSTVLT